jgi:hypothetical protein
MSAQTEGTERVKCVHSYLTQRKVYEASYTLAVLLRMWHYTAVGKHLVEGLSCVQIVCKCVLIILH